MAAPAPAQGHKVFVGGLPPDCTPEELQTVFTTYGAVEDVHIMPPKSKIGLRCAFVTYTKQESAEDAIKVLDGIYKIREDAEAPIQVNWPRQKRDDWGAGGKGDWGKGGGYGGKGDWGGKGGDWGGKGGGGKDAGGKGDEGQKLFVGSLPGDCTEDELKIVFNTYGEVKSVHLMAPHERSGMRCAFIAYAKPESAEDAIKVLHGIYKIRENAEQPIVVRWANAKRSDGGAKGQDKGYGKGGYGGYGKGGGDWGWQQDSWGGGGGWGNDWGKGGKGYQDDWAKGGKKGDGKGYGAKGGQQALGPPQASGKVYVSNLPEDIQQNALEYVFGTYGKVGNVHIMSNKVVNGCVSAFVEFGTPDEAETAIASLHEKYEIRPGYGTIVVRHASSGGKGRSRPY